MLNLRNGEVRYYSLNKALGETAPREKYCRRSGVNQNLPRRYRPPSLIADNRPFRAPPIKVDLSPFFFIFRS